MTVPGPRCICHNEIYGKVHLMDDASIAPYEFHFITHLFVSPPKKKTKECSDVFSLYISAFLFFMILSLWQYRIILSADTASEVRQMLSQKRR